MFYNLDDLTLQSGLNNDFLLDQKKCVRIVLDRHLKNVKVQDSKYDDDSIYIAYNPIAVEQLAENSMTSESGSFTPKKHLFIRQTNIQFRDSSKEYEEDTETEK